MYMKKHGMERNRGGGGGVLNLTSTTTFAMNKVMIALCFIYYFDGP